MHTAGKQLTGQNTVTLIPLRNNLNKVTLDAESLFVTDVLDSKDTPLSYDQTEDKLHINLSRTYSYADTIKFTVKYYLAKQVAGLRFIDKTEHSPLQVSSDCFPNKARQWIPCYDYPHDKVTQEMIVTVDNKYKVLSNGTLLGITKDNKRRKHTYHWKQSKQHSTYLINLSIADYAIIEDSLGSLPINYWVYPEHVEKFEFKLDAEPLMVRFDDGNHLLKEWTENKTEEELLFQVENDDAPGRLWAIDQLKSFHSSPKMIQKWTELAMTDPFWAVREAAAQTISEFHGSSSKAIFLQTIGDSNSKVRAASIKALGEINEPSMVGNFRNIYETDDSYLVMAEALIAIGKNGNKSHLGFLDQAAKVRSPRNTLKNAAEQAIEMIRNPQ